MKEIVPNKPACRHCGTPVQPLRRCPKCGRRSILAFFFSHSTGKWIS